MFRTHTPSSALVARQRFVYVADWASRLVRGVCPKLDALGPMFVGPGFLRNRFTWRRRTGA